MQKNSDYAIEMVNITKMFPGIKANDDITLEIKKGEIHALVGENGAGKSTLVSILFGLYNPDAGYIRVNGQNKIINNPNDANDLGIGMVHQHFKLIDVYNAIDNIILGKEPTKMKSFLYRATAKKKLQAISNKYKFKVNLSTKIEKASVGEQQRVEILKMLYRDVNILIFDEPTAVLTPQEITGLLKTMKDLKKDGKTIIFISHKLDEIKQVADRATIIRHGKKIDTVDVKKTSKEKIASLMVGRKLVKIKNKSVKKSDEIILQIKNLTMKHRSQKNVLGLKNVSFDIKKNEIVAIAGVEGNGQTELINAITGLADIKSGKILYKDNDITKTSIAKKYNLGISHVPEDRHKFGMVLDFDVKDNMVIQTIGNNPFSKWGIINFAEIQKFTNQVIKEFDVRGARGGKSISRKLSGGNQQKAVFGREASKDHDFLIAAQPTRGLDLGAIEFIHKTILSDKAKGKSVLLISYELDEVISLADRIVVLNAGQVTGIVDAKKTSREQIGLLMGEGAKHD